MSGVAVLAAVALAGCGTSVQSQVRSTVREFATAVQHHDLRTLCDHVLAPTLLADIASGGITCEHALSLGLAGVRDARLVIGSVSVSGRHASVVTLSQAAGEHSVVATLELIRTAAGWRIASLGNATGG
ncbi:MAG TPA: hypothetical protein VFP55_03745 [Solirubrobacteraceae bacterium]|nr:hypothetical protein [Solirubrobacteraceae bacterium]